MAAMADYVRFGGIIGGRALDLADAFEFALSRQLGDRMKTDDDLCTAVWCALSNVEWAHENGGRARYSFRAAGDLVAAVRGDGDYLDWYCSGRDSVVRPDIGEALAREGWAPAQFV
jgi:hypothetical protein